MRCADTGKVRQGGLNYIGIGGPRRHAILDILSEIGVLAVAIGVSVIFASSQGNPGVHAFG